MWPEHLLPINCDGQINTTLDKDMMTVIGIV